MRTAEEILKSMVSDIEAMQVDTPANDLTECSDDYHGHWFGDFEAVGYDDQNDGVIIQWPCLGILLEEAKAALAPKYNIISDGEGWWDQHTGWVYFKHDATRYSDEERNEMDPPIGGAWEKDK